MKRDLTWPPALADTLADDLFRATREMPDGDWTDWADYLIELGWRPGGDA